MTRRAELVDQTRLEITAATARLHTSIGPANTTIAAIADEAGVTRLTVYRHFPDLEALFVACRAHWRSENPPPDSSTWSATPGLETRVRRALTAHYGWYRDHAEELFPIYRDMTTAPLGLQETMRAENRRLGALLVEGHAAEGESGRPMRAAARHLLAYPTWRSLAIDQGLSDAEAVELGVTVLEALRDDARNHRRHVGSEARQVKGRAEAL